MSFKQLLIVFQYTFKEIIKSKILINTLAVGFFIFLASYISSEFSYGVQKRVALDIGLAGLTLSSIVIAIFMGSTLISKDIEQRTIYMIISRPVPRSTFLLGRFLGFVAVLAVNILILSLFTLLCFVMVGGELTNLIYWSIFFQFLEVMLVCSIIVFFSLIVNTTIAILFTIVMFIAGHSFEELLKFIGLRYSSTIVNIVKGLDYIFPSFYKLNIKDYVLYENNLEFNFLASSTIYCLLYVSIFIISSCFIFERKNLD